MNDVISRQAAIDAFYLYPNINWTTLDILKKINEIPTIQPDNNSEMPNSSDVISRQAAIDAIEKNACNTQRIFDAVKALPPAEPKRGKWVLVCDNNGMHFICNKCGAWRYHQEQKFCGECGAKMEVTT